MQDLAAANKQLRNLQIQAEVERQFLGLLIVRENKAQRAALVAIVSPPVETTSPATVPG